MDIWRGHSYIEIKHPDEVRFMVPDPGKTIIKLDENLISFSNGGAYAVVRENRDDRFYLDIDNIRWECDYLAVPMRHI